MGMSWRQGGQPVPNRMWGSKGAPGKVASEEQRVPTLRFSLWQDWQVWEVLFADLLTNDC